MFYISWPGNIQDYRMQMQLRQEDISQQIKHKEFEINTKKINILIEWASHLFTSYHRCVLCFITQRSFADEDLPIAEVERFKNGANLLKDLQDGLMVSLVHREKKAIEVKINQDFFELLPVLIERTRSKLGLELNTKIMNGTEQLKICKVCGIIRSQTEIQFIGETCKCEAPAFVPFEKDQKRLKKLSMIGGMIDRVLREHQGIKRIEEDIAHLNRAMRKLQNRRETEYERFVKMHQLKQAPAELRNSQKTQRRARMEFGRFPRLQQMKRVRNKRRQILNSQAQQSDRRQFWVEKKPSTSVARVKKISFPEKEPNWKEEYGEERNRRRPFLGQMPAEQAESMKKANLLEDALTAHEIQGSAKQYQRNFNKKKNRAQFHQYFQASQESQEQTRPQQSSDH